MKIKGSISRRISVVFTIFVIAIVTVLQLNHSVTTQNQLSERTIDQIQASSKLNAQMIDSWLEQQAQNVRSIAKGLESIDSLKKAPNCRYLASQLALNEDALMYYVTFGYNNAIYPADGSDLELVLSERPWWNGAIESEDVYYTAPYLDASSGQMVVTISYACTIGGEQAVVLADITIDQLLTMVNAITEGDDTMSAFLTTSDGEVIVHEDSELLPSEEGLHMLTDKYLVDLTAKGIESYGKRDGSTWDLSLSKCEATGWILGVEKDHMVIQRTMHQNVVQSTELLLIMIVVVVIILSLVIRKLLAPVRRVAFSLEKIAQGDFSATLPATRRRDEVGVLQNSMNVVSTTLSDMIGETNQVLGSVAKSDLSVRDMKEYQGAFNEIATSVNRIKAMLRSLLTEIASSASEVDDGAGQLASAADALAQSSTEQALSAEKLQSDIEDMSEKIRNNSEACDIVNERLGDLDRHIQAGNEDMTTLYEKVEAMEQYSADIQAVVSVIDNIAFQTNILALNASVEAARAGEHGKGFAVVAEEVRSLAVKCAGEAQKTGELVDRCIETISGAKTNADSTFKVLKDVAEESAEIADKFEGISADTSVQAANASDIQSEIRSITDVVQANTATAEQTAASTVELSEQADKLKKMIGRFNM